MKNDKIIFPSYYKDFKCKASRCSENCCLGWEIDIDAKAQKRYAAMQGELGEKIRKNMAVSGGVSHFVMKNGRCPMLNGENLCEIIIALGDGALCEICREHPRYYNTLSGVTLGGVGMSCEAAAELMIGQKKPSLYGDISPLLDKDDEDYGRAKLIAEALFKTESILCSERISERDKIKSVLLAAQELEVAICKLYFGSDEDAESFAYVDIFDENLGEAEPLAARALRDLLPSLEFMSDRLTKTVEGAKWKNVVAAWRCSADFRRVILNSLGYLAARYLPRADGDFKPSSFILGSLIILALLFSECECFSKGKEGFDCVPDEITRAAVLYSAEIEYSEENVEKMNIL